MSNHQKEIYLLNLFEPRYKELKVKELFEKEQKKNNILKFGYICPGATKTLKFIKKNIKSDSTQKIFEKIRRFTDGLFFVELIALYSKYIDKKFVKEMNDLMSNKSCVIAKAFTKVISEQFEKLPKYISQNLPDDFYHLRHKTLVCSNDKKMVEDRIKMLKKIYEKFTNLSKNICDGKRDGVSGCRDCCKKYFGSGADYIDCVDKCMKY